MAALQKGGCGACHVIPGVPGAAGTIGPDLTAIGDVVEARLESRRIQRGSKKHARILPGSVECPGRLYIPGLRRENLQPGLDDSLAGPGIERR